MQSFAPCPEASLRWIRQSVAGVAAALLVSLLLSTALKAVAADITLAKDNPMMLSLQVQGARHALLTGSPIGETDAAAPVVIQLGMTNAMPGDVAVRVTARDMFETELWSKEVTIAVDDDGAGEAQIEVPGRLGYVALEAVAGDARTWTNYAVIPPSREGVRPDSLFCSNTSGVHTGSKAELLQLIGVKVQRAHFQPEVKAPASFKDGPVLDQPLELDFKKNDAAFAECKERGLWVLPIAGYALHGFDMQAKTELAERLGMHGPVRDHEEFIRAWEQILQHYPEINAIEFWNEPWIFGWTWAAPAAEYRALQKAWCERMLKIRPDLMIVAGNSSMFLEDNVEVDPTCYRGLVRAGSHHPYGYSTSQASFRRGDQFRSMDYGMQVSNRMGFERYYLTEGGTEFATPQPEEIVALQARIKTAQGEEKKALEKRLQAMKAHLPHPKNNLENAAKIVQYYLRFALLGGFQGNNQWEIGYGPSWTRPNAAIAVMTHLLEDRVILADVWPEHELVFGAIFAHPKFFSPEVRALPRADELGARWSVAVPEERRNDATKVAVVYAATGPSADAVDTQGRLVLENRDGALRAFSVDGVEIAGADGTLSVPLREAPSYILTDTLDVIALRERIRTGRIENVTPINLYAMPLSQPADRPQALTVRLENQMNEEVLVALTLKISGRTTATTLTIPAAKLVDAQIPWPGVVPNEHNQYGIEIAADVTAAGRKLPVPAHKQIIQAARFVRRTVAVDGTLDDWQGVTPVLVDSRQLARGFDPTLYLLNPGLQTVETAEDRVVARAYTAYDDANVYLAFAVQEKKLANSCGKPVVKGRKAEKVELPYRTAMPDGLVHPAHTGDAVQFAFGFRPRVPGLGRQLDDPYAWKGFFYDTDYVYHAMISTDGDRLVRQWGPDTTRQNGYQTDDVSFMRTPEGARIKIRRDDEQALTVYEIALPRSELKLFDSQAGKLRFLFQISSGEAGMLNWSEAAGVFDHWRTMGSLSPTWMQTLPCQTFFGIESGRE